MVGRKCRRILCQAVALLLTLKGKCLRRRARPAHVGSHLPRTWQHEGTSKIGEVFSDRLLLDYPYLLFARTLQVMMEAAKQTERSDHQTKGDARTLSMSEKMGDGSGSATRATGVAGMTASPFSPTSC